MLNFQADFAQINCEINQNLDAPFASFFTRLIAGDKNTHSGFADITNQDLFLWGEAKIGQDIYIKKVSNSINRFNQAKHYLINKEDINIEDLIHINKILCPKSNSNTIRKKPIRAGNPEKIDHAFYCCPPEKIENRLTNLLEIINSGDDLVSAFIVMMQFVLIHPFSDANGRISRLLFLKILNNHNTPIYSYLLLIYIKIINYYKKSTHDKSPDSIHDCSRVVIKVLKKNTMKLSGFEYHCKKNNQYIFINTALLSCSNQFEYYLKFQMREFFIDN